MRNFPDHWKKGNVPVHTKDNEKLVNNYRLLSLLPILSKDFEELVFDAIFEFVIENNLLRSTQKRFKPNDFCVNQLISITHNVYSAFDANPSLEVCGVILGISRAFYRDCHKSLLYKLKL